MQNNRFLRIIFAGLIVVAGSCLSTLNAVWAARRESVLHRFSAKDGANPLGGLVFDSAGNLYGTTSQYGTYDFGTVFRLAPGANGTWAETVLHEFSGQDGNGPLASLVFDPAGNLYGTTFRGGTLSDCDSLGCGVVFKLAPTTNGKWIETVLHKFKGSDGGSPMGSLTFDAEGSLYGTTAYGGSDPSGCGGVGCGTVFRLTPGTNGNWSEQLLHTFNSNGKGGAEPLAGLAFDTAGNLYGTTYGGGACPYGTVFKLTPSTNGRWNERVLYSFCNGEANPEAGIILDAKGNLYTTTYYGGAYRQGTVSEFSPQANGEWTQKVLHSFNPNGKDGANPKAGLMFDTAGNLYGTTFYGGNLQGFPNGHGVVFKLAPGTNNTWDETILYAFCSASSCKDGAFPESGVIIDSSRNLYGTAEGGGTNDDGTVFKIAP
jgi:uncharacterized repeat protein (TIGR03803 family)